jgi:hypothetical protein
MLNKRLCTGGDLRDVLCVKVGFLNTGVLLFLLMPVFLNKFLTQFLARFNTTRIISLTPNKFCLYTLTTPPTITTIIKINFYYLLKTERISL